MIKLCSTIPKSNLNLTNHNKIPRTAATKKITILELPTTPSRRWPTLELIKSRSNVRSHPRRGTMRAVKTRRRSLLRLGRKRGRKL